MKSVWEVLGIERTTDIKRIKQAYAAKAREWHPEEHPQEYQMLQKAYKSAIQAAKTQKPTDIYVETPDPVPPQETEEIPSNTGGETEFLRNPVSQGTNIEWNNKLDFGEVQRKHTKEVRDRFFQEFRYIVWNPYLKDNFIVWRSFLGNPEYQELFSEKEFPEQFLYTVSSYPYWNKEVLRLFEERLETLSKNCSNNKEVWKRIRFSHRLEELLSLEGVMTFREGIRGVHEMMLEQVKNKGIEVIGRIGSREAANCYLKFYLPYAAEHEYLLKEDYEKLYRSRKRLEMFKILIFAAVLLAGLLFCEWVSHGKRPTMEDNMKQLEEGISELERLRQELEENKSGLGGLRLEFPDVSESVEETFH